MSHLVISFICSDRAGIVDELSNIVSSHHGNWQSSSMHHLSGTFAGIIEISIEQEKVENLLADFNKVTGLETIHQVSQAEQTSQETAVVLELTANDRVGIVQEISSAIHHQGGNLLKLVSTQESAPHSGQNLFKAKATIAVSAQHTETLVDALENLADDLMVDISR